ncbi:hypothetical protein [Rheinheimera sp. 4Y26]|nr:hypothetical protein [Rheinheimera sp. 4Y26]MCT6698947.1 hypothetical protein [Rheinheimera sp. 4Y26]
MWLNLVKLVALLYTKPQRRFIPVAPAALMPACNISAQPLHQMRNNI